jgi:N-methylhydantoinase A/oxoprolinase/acetone carboxylase beta subunit
MTKFRVGVDIGGTFTDIVFLGEDGRRLTKKVSSTVDNYATAIVDGLAELIRERGLDEAEIVELLHGTTVASNAILELKGARTGLITTKGFRDVLEIRTLRMPRLYDLSWVKPPPLVERDLRVEVDERIDAKGEVERPLAEADVARAVEKLIDEGVEAIAVCLIHSYLNPVHEQLVEKVAAQMAPTLTAQQSLCCRPCISRGGADFGSCPMDYKRGALRGKRGIPLQNAPLWRPLCARDLQPISFAAVRARKTKSQQRESRPSLGLIVR